MLPRTPSGASVATEGFVLRGTVVVRRPLGARPRPRAGVVIAVTALLLAACGGTEDATTTRSGSTSSSASETTAGSTLAGDLTVFAAASLTESFTTLGEAFTTANPGLTVAFNFAGSSALATQINEGAPADLFAAASPTTMQTVVDAGGAAGEPEVFVTNTLEIAVPPGNPAGITGLADFANADLTIALCAAEVPCGSAAEKVFAAAGLTPAPDTLEQDVKAALSKVELGEVDAALVYRTDVISSGDGVEGIEFPESSDAVNDYPISVLTEAPNAEAAQAFLDYVLSDEGQQVLTDAGFGSP